ncbi:MAG TPA: lipopolysaccharide biosynthesis protein [Blastococcus sp.]|nr:lipopolysaccharide biosynthesis protein [Blastococcus sp.]
MDEALVVRADEPVPSDQLARHGLLYTFGVVVQGLASLAVLPFVTRLLGPVQYGHVAVGLSVIQLGAVIAVAGLPAAITRAYFEHRDGRRRSRAMLGLVVGLGLVLAAVALSLWPVIGAVFSLSLASVGAMTLVVGGQAVLRAQGRPIVFILTAIGSTAGSHLVGLGFASVSPTATSYLTGYLIGAGATAVVALLITPPMPPHRVPGAIREGTRIILPVIPHTAALVVLTSADPLIVARLLGTGAAGSYQVAMLLGIAPLAVLSGLNNAWTAAIMGARDEDRWPLLARTLRPVMAVAAVLAVGVALAAPLAVQLLAPATFDHATMSRLVQVIALCTPAQVVYLGAATVVFHQKRTSALAWVTPLAAAAFVLSAVPLAMSLGVVGVAVAKVIGFVALAVATALAASRVADVRWRGTAWLPIVVAVVLVVLTLQFVPATATAAWVQVGVAAVLGLVAAFLAQARWRRASAGRLAPLPPAAAPDRASTGLTAPVITEPGPSLPRLR